MPRTTIRSEDITDLQVKTADVAASNITTAKMAVDPTNASNLSSGSVPLAQLGNAPATDVTGLEDDIALLGFRVASNGSLAKYNLVDQTVDDFQDATGVNASASTNELRNADNNYYEGGTAGTVTGGNTISTHGSYTVHTFTASGTFTTDVAGTADVLLVGGGGSGGGGHYNGGSGGGAGAGGVRALSAQTVSAAGHAVTVGPGATGSQLGVNGTPSSIVLATTLSAAGGGGGGFGTVDTPASYDGMAGASGGGGGIGIQIKVGGAGNQPATTPAQGYPGGDAKTGGAGGGGGSAGAGPDAPGSGSLGGPGADGIQNDWRTGSDIYYGGGGGGSGWPTPTPSPGGEGGGGASGYAGGNVGTAGTVNTGGGGGGSHGANGSHWVGASGGSGIVIIRYDTAAGFTDPANLTLVSTTTAAQAAPTKGDIVFTHTNGAGTTTLGTDVTAEISADGGSTWTPMTLGSEGSTGTHNIATAHNVTISSTITSPWNMAYRIKTFNQSASKSTRLRAVSLGWS